MDQAVCIQLQSIHQDAEGVETVEESSHAGMLQVAEDVLVLRYTDASAEDGPPSEVLLQLSDGRLRYHRAGEYAVEAFYREGEDCAVCYSTPYGDLSMRIHTKWLRWSFDGIRGLLSLRYQLSAQEEEISETRLDISFAPPEADV